MKVIVRRGLSVAIGLQVCGRKTQCDSIENSLASSVKALVRQQLSKSITLGNYFYSITAWTPTLHTKRNNSLSEVTIIPKK